MMIKKLCLFGMLSVASMYSAYAPNTFIASVTGLDSPYQIAITPNNLYGYVTEQGTSNSVRVVNTDPSSPNFNLLIAAPALSGVFNNPIGIAITPNNDFAYVCDSGSNSVLVIDTNPSSPTYNTLIAAPALIGVFSGPQDIAITSDGHYAYVINPTSNNANVIDINPTSPTYNTVLVTPGLDGILNNPFYIVITPDENYAYVSNLAGSMSVIDIRPASSTYNTLVATTTGVNAQPEGFAITPNGLSAYVSDGSANDVTIVNINVTDPTLNTVSAPAALATAFNAPNGVAATADGSYAYVSNFLGASGSTSSVSVIDTNPLSPTYNTVLDTPGLVLPDPITRFFTITVTPNAQFVYAVDGFNNRINVIYTGVIYNGQVNPPINFAGCKINNIFLLQADLINRLTWAAPLTGNAPVAYKIYRDEALTQLIATVPATETLSYDDHNRAGITDTYYIVSIDAFNQVSTAASTTVTQYCA